MSERVSCVGAGATRRLVVVEDAAVEALVLEAAALFGAHAVLRLVRLHALELRERAAALRAAAALLAARVATPPLRLAAVPLARARLAPAFVRVAALLLVRAPATRAAAASLLLAARRVAARWSGGLRRSRAHRLAQLEHVAHERVAAQVRVKARPEQLPQRVVVALQTPRVERNVLRARHLNQRTRLDNTVDVAILVGRRAAATAAAEVLLQLLRVVEHLAERLALRLAVALRLVLRALRVELAQQLEEAGERVAEMRAEETLGVFGILVAHVAELEQQRDALGERHTHAGRGARLEQLEQLVEEAVGQALLEVAHRHHRLQQRPALDARRLEARHVARLVGG